MYCSSGKLTRNRCLSVVLIFLQVFSGKQPWSEVHEEARIVLQLYRGHTPGRPESRTMEDAHWSFIQSCWSSLQERPAADTIVLIVQQFLNDRAPSVSLHDLFISPRSRVNSDTNHKREDQDVDLPPLQVSGSHSQVSSKSLPHGIPTVADGSVPEKKSSPIAQSSRQRGAARRIQFHEYLQQIYRDSPLCRLGRGTSSEDPDGQPIRQEIVWRVCTLLIILFCD